MPAATPMPPAARAELSAQLHSIWPGRPGPVALARVDELPAGVALRTGPATSACLFWREAERGVFAVGPEHGTCPIGRISQGFTTELPTADALIGTMVETGYVDPAELASLPTLPLGHAAIVYGPLADIPVDPEAVLLVGTPEQVMILGEALGVARLDGTGLTVLGRPTCAAVAAAILRDQPRGSLACVGARIFAGFEPGELLMVIPGSMLGRLASALARTVAANERLGALDLELKRCLAETA